MPSLFKLTITNLLHIILLFYHILTIVSCEFIVFYLFYAGESLTSVDASQFWCREGVLYSMRQPTCVGDVYYK